MHESLGDIVSGVLDAVGDLSSIEPAGRRSPRWARWLIWAINIVLVLSAVALIAAIFWPR